MRAKSDRDRITPYVPRQVSQRLRAICASTGVTESAFVTAALVREMDGTSDMMLILRRLDRLGRALARVHRDLELLLELVGAYVFRSLAQEPNVPEELRVEMRARGVERYKQFVEHVGKRFLGGHRFVDDLPHEVIANDAELDAMLAKSNGTGGAH